MLWFTRGVAVVGVKALAETLSEYYASTWHLDPELEHLRSTVISTDMVQILVSITFTRGRPGKPSRINTFLVS